MFVAPYRRGRGQERAVGDLVIFDDRTPFGREAAMAEKRQPQNPGDDAPAGTPGTGEDVCPDCRGTGRRDGRECETCGGTGHVVEGIGGA